MMREALNIRVVAIYSTITDAGYPNQRKRFRYRIYIGLLSIIINLPVSAKTLAKNQSTQLSCVGSQWLNNIIAIPAAIIIAATIACLRL
jgi:hypothetical protein